LISPTNRIHFFIACAFISFDQVIGRIPFLGKRISDFENLEAKGEFVLIFHLFNLANYVWTPFFNFLEIHCDRLLIWLGGIYDAVYSTLTASFGNLL